jgi:peptidoglycan/LPS O-acetylase OafA/YrhL
MHTHHIKSLDSIRGIAAINVVLYHFYLLSNSESSLYSSGKIWASGHEAVILFFVLSQSML